jgi:predicted nucleic acid-binding protein
MSSVVALELFAGCRTNRERNALSGFLKPFEKAGRIVTPDHGCYVEAGRVLAGLSRDGVGRSHRRQIVSDILIAVTAARSGLVVITDNASDFVLIEKHLALRWMPPEAATSELL